MSKDDIKLLILRDIRAQLKSILVSADFSLKKLARLEEALEADAEG